MIDPIEGTKVITSRGEHNFKEDDAKMGQGVHVVSSTRDGDLPLDRSVIVQLPPAMEDIPKKKEKKNKKG